jgi:hypothetical protein
MIQNVHPGSRGTVSFTNIMPCGKLGLPVYQLWRGEAVQDFNIQSLYVVTGYVVPVVYRYQMDLNPWIRKSN